MPQRAISKIMTATEPADVAQMAMIECLRQIADGNKKLNSVLEGMQVEIRDVRERLIRIEASEFKVELSSAKAEIDRLRKEDVKGLESRIHALETKDHKRDGAKGFADAILKYGPFIIALVTALFVVLVATRKIIL